jgi:ribosome-binding protein aMBF1 (putative translation factor)
MTRTDVLPFEITCEMCGRKMGVTTFNRNGDGVFGKVCDDCEKIVAKSIDSLFEEEAHAHEA